MGQSWVAGTALPWWRGAGWRGRLVAVVLVTQLLVPLVALSLESPTRFGFQMFSGLGVVRLHVTDDTGRRHEIELGQVSAADRPELNWLDRMPEYLCRTSPNAVAATVAQDGVSRTVSCER